MSSSHIEKKKTLVSKLLFPQTTFCDKATTTTKKKGKLFFFFLDVNAPKKKKEFFFFTDSNMRRESCFQKGKVRLFRSNKAEHLLKRSLCDEVRK